MKQGVASNTHCGHNMVLRSHKLHFIHHDKVPYETASPALLRYPQYQYHTVILQGTAWSLPIKRNSAALLLFRISVWLLMLCHGMELSCSLSSRAYPQHARQSQKPFQVTGRSMITLHPCICYYHYVCHLNVAYLS